MSVSFGCHCAERKKPVEDRNWVVLCRNFRCSAFDGYRVMYSDYSEVQCLTCHATGRTKAAFVMELKDYEQAAEEKTA